MKYIVNQLEKPRTPYRPSNARTLFVHRLVKLALDIDAKGVEQLLHVVEELEHLEARRVLGEQRRRIAGNGTHNKILKWVSVVQRGSAVRSIGQT